MTNIFSRREAPATKLLLLANGLLFLLEFLWGPGIHNLLIEVFGLSRVGLAAGFLWQPVTHMFFHGNLFHLIVNLVALYFAGRVVELWLGSARFLTVYFLGGIVGGLLQVLSISSGNLIGASGGVCAILLVFTTLEPEMEITALIFFVIPVRLRAKYLGWGIIAISVLLPLLGWDGSVGHLAHLGGALTGLAYAFWLRKTGRFHSRSAPAWGGNVFSSRSSAPPHSPARSAHTAHWKAETATQEIDAILNKVARHGLHSLTPTERAQIERWNRGS